MRKLDFIDVMVIMVFGGITIFLVMWYTKFGIDVFRYLHEIARQVWISTHLVK
jgi:hypothetical protein